VIVIFDNLFDVQECANLINEYEVNKHNAHEHRGTKPLDLRFIPSAKEAIDRIQLKVNSIFNVQYDWGEIVQWGEKTFQPLHVDDASKETILTSIVYLNENFAGGNTVFDDGTLIKPIIGRCLVFNGMEYTHGVSEVSNGVRWTLPIWYKCL
jgi:hypothetical protein